jgi:hypothetical protein
MIMPARRLLPALAAAVAALATTAAAPAAAQTWTPPATIAAPHTFVLSLDAAASGDGTAVARWSFQDGIGNTAAPGAAGASRAPAAAAFGPQQQLPRGTTQLVPYARRSVAALVQTPLDAAGNRLRLAVAFGSAAGPTLGATRTVAQDDVAFVPRLAVGPDGSGLLAWVARASGGRRIVKVALRAPGGRFGAPSVISGTGRANTITAAAGPAGERVVAFERAGRLIARFRPARGPWGPLQDLGAVAALSDNRLAALVTGGGRATVVDVHRQLSEGGDTGPFTVDAWVQAAGSSRFRAGQRLEQGGAVNASPPALVPGDGRGAVLAWVGADPSAPPTPNGVSTRVRVAVQGADGRFGAAQDLSPAAQPVAAVSGAGNGSATVVSWVRLAPVSDVSGQVLAAVRPVNGAFGAVEPVAPADNASSTAATFAGDRPLVLWAARPAGEGPGIPVSQIQTVVRAAVRTP